MELSRKVVSKHWWKFLWFLIVLALIHLFGYLCCWVGIFVATPFSMAALAYAYEDIFGPAAKESGLTPVMEPVAPVRSGTGLGAVIGVAAGVAAALTFIAFLGLMAAIAIPNFVAGRERAIAAREQEKQAVLAQIHMQQEKAVKARLEAKRQEVAIQSDYIGQTNFPNGDAIVIDSVERTEERMVVKGHYNLVSADMAKLRLKITGATNFVGQPDPQEETDIAKGQGEFTLTDGHVVPGLPCVSMSSFRGKSFAEIYFGTQAEALEESKLMLAGPKVISVSPANGATNVEPTQELRVHFDEPMDSNDFSLDWSAGGFILNGMPHYEAAQYEFVFPVRLLAGQTNEVTFNRDERGFCATNHNSASEFDWKFTTRPVAPTLGATLPKVVQISPGPDDTLPVLTMLQITFDQPMMPPGERLPYLLQKGRPAEVPSIVPCIDYDPAARRFTIPLVLPPDNETKVILDGFFSAAGVASDPVVLHCKIGTNSISTEQASLNRAAAKDRAVAIAHFDARSADANDQRSGIRSTDFVVRRLPGQNRLRPYFVEFGRLQMAGNESVLRRYFRGHGHEPEGVYSGNRWKDLLALWRRREQWTPAPQQPGRRRGKYIHGRCRSLPADTTDGAVRAGKATADLRRRNAT